MAVSDRLDAAHGTVVVRRRPHRPSSPLRAWDAADEYVIAHLAEIPPPSGATRWIVVNDAFGALGVALAHQQPYSWSDSTIAHAALRSNLELNALPDESVTRLSSIDDPPTGVDVVVVKIPKSGSVLEDQLCRLSAVVGPATVVVGAGMTRHVHSSTVEAFERIIGPTRTTPARRRARLLLASVDPGRPPSVSPYPTSFRVRSETIRSADRSTGDLQVWNHAGVFSSSRLDIGTRFLLEHLLDIACPTRVVDLGCGNGVVGTVMALRHTEVSVVFTDESAAAVASAELTFRGACGARPASFLCGEGAPGIEDGSVGLVVLNPPFHDRHAVDVDAGRPLLAEAHRILAQGGRLVVVSNRHVGHHLTLARQFGEKPTVVASNPKFVVLTATKH